MKLLIKHLCLLPLVLASLPHALEAMEARSITAHYLPEDIWPIVAQYLDGADLFLNTDIAHRFSLDANTRYAIFKSFVKKLDKCDQQDIVRLTHSFFKHNTLNANLHTWACHLGELASALPDRDAVSFKAILKNSPKISLKVQKKILRFLLSKAHVIQKALQTYTDDHATVTLTKKNNKQLQVCYWYLGNQLIKLGRNLEQSLLVVVIPIFMGLIVAKYLRTLYARSTDVNMLIRLESLTLLCLFYSGLTAVNSVIHKRIKTHKKIALTEITKVIDIIRKQLTESD